LYEAGGLAGAVLQLACPLDDVPFSGHADGYFSENQQKVPKIEGRPVFPTAVISAQQHKAEQVDVIVTSSAWELPQKSVTRKN
jgi:hypothetical protein